MSSSVTIQGALLSVSDKTGLLDLARTLHTANVQILSTGGTARYLLDNGIEVTQISDHTGFPEMMQGRVKTLHPKIHGGILANIAQDEATMRTHGITAIDLVVVNLYPFAKTISTPDCDVAKAIEQIDIGGVALMRSAAKNFARVTVLTDPSDYKNFCQTFTTQQGTTTLPFRRQYAEKAFACSAHYDGLIANYFQRLNAETSPASPAASPFTQELTLQLSKVQDLRYGENPQQKAALYRNSADTSTGHIVNARQHQGKALSFNNLADADAALACNQALTRQMPEQAACVIVKHMTPCGVATGPDLTDSYKRAYACDPISAFGGIIACNQTLDAKTSKAILEQQFTEVIVAPAVDEAALSVLASKPNIRVLSTGAWADTHDDSYAIKRIAGGLLLQTLDHSMMTMRDMRIVSQRKPSDAQMADLLFAWIVAQFVKSNAIVYAKAQQTIGIGAGQCSRIDSAKIGVMKAQANHLPLAGCVMASDAFFPFRDSVDAAAQAGVKAIIQPGGSRRDEEVINAANEHQLAMIFTDTRHFLH